MAPVEWDVLGSGSDYLAALYAPLYHGTQADVGAHHFTLELGNRSIVFDGEFQLDAGGGITGGTITGFHLSDQGFKYLDASGYAIDIDDFTQAFNAVHDDGNTDPMQHLLFSNPMTMKGDGNGNYMNGTAAGDHLIGRGGDDMLFGNQGRDILSGGSGNDACYGDTGKDTINGGKGNDTLDGAQKSDVLTGGGGHDAFIFDSDLGPKNIDRITDFQHGKDVIQLGTDIFGGAYGETLDPDAFHVGAHAKDAEDRIIYDKSTGALYFDADGKGGAAQVQFAKLDGHPTLDAHNFLFI